MMLLHGRPNSKDDEFEATDAGEASKIIYSG